MLLEEVLIEYKNHLSLKEFSSQFISEFGGTFAH